MYCALFWIQGKTDVAMLQSAAVLYCALFWIQGKTKNERFNFLRHCTVPYFGFKAKLKMKDLIFCDIVLCLILDSRQNLHDYCLEDKAIVLCLILDSRQNEYLLLKDDAAIVLCLILDSRQNDCPVGVVLHPIVLCLILDSRQN